MRKTELPVKKTYFNKAQLRLILSKAKEATSNWPRGTGKSTIIAWIKQQAAKRMPRGAGTITGITYEQILTRTLPSTIASLEKLGWKKDVHYWIGHRPPRKLKIPTPFQPPLKYDHFITTYTGFGFHLVSQDRNTSVRGLNTDVQITDESLLLDIERYTQEVLGTNRGNEEHFSKVPFHHGIFHFTSMPFTGDGNWILKKSEYYDHEYNDHKPYDFTVIKNQLIKLQLEFIRNKNVDHRKEIHRAIIDQEKQLRFYTCNWPENDDFHRTFYSEATAWDNLMNVGIKYLERQYRDMIPELFVIEMLGQRKKKTIGGFYPTFERDLHGYKGHYNYSYLDSIGFDFTKLQSATAEKDMDCDTNEPLYLSVDWGGNINFMLVGQRLPGRNAFNFINEFYAKHPLILDDAFKLFIAYYKNHKYRRVIFYYDRNGNQKLANSKVTFAEQGAALLRESGWTVEMKSLGNNPYHNEKYLLFGRLYKQAHLTPSERDARYPTIKFNLIKCKFTVMSIENAPAKEASSNEIKKDKKSELSSIIPQEQATHASDAHDNILFPLYSSLIEEMVSLPPAQWR
jgi:hypothetical protein